MKKASLVPELHLLFALCVVFTCISHSLTISLFSLSIYFVRTRALLCSALSSLQSPVSSCYQIECSSASLCTDSRVRWSVVVDCNARLLVSLVPLISLLRSLLLLVALSRENKTRCNLRARRYFLPLSTFLI